MSKKYFGKIVFFLAFFALNNGAYAQANPAFVEKDLPDNGTKAQVKTAANDKDKNVQSSVLLDRMKTGIAAVLLNEKLSSLMFDDDENKNIDRAIDSLKNNQAYVPEGAGSSEGDETQDKAQKKLEENKKSRIYLASIIYLNPQYWVVWVNEKKITSETNKKDKEIYLKSVERDRVKIVWKLGLSKWQVLSNKPEDMAPKVNEKGEVEIEFELKPNQTYNLTSGKIIEGKVSVVDNGKKSEKPNKQITPPTENNGQQNTKKVTLP